MFRHGSQNDGSERMKYQYDGKMKKILCGHCGNVVVPLIEDNSFSHEFGTETIINVWCPECDADFEMTDEVEELVMGQCWKCFPITKDEKVQDCKKKRK